MRHNYLKDIPVKIGSYKATCPKCAYSINVSVSDPRGLKVFMKYDTYCAHCGSQSTGAIFEDSIMNLVSEKI